MIEDDNDDTELTVATISWIVAGRSGMSLCGYTIDDNLNDEPDPSITIHTSASGTWSFHFRDFKGEGRIQVSKGTDYNPIDLIETLFRHLHECKTVEDEIEAFESKKPAPIQWDNTVIDFSNIEGFAADWE